MIAININIVANDSWASEESIDCAKNSSSHPCLEYRNIDSVMESVTLKTALLLNDENINTLEEMVSLNIDRSSDFKDKMSHYFEDDSFDYFYVKVKDATYWKKDTRFNQQESFASILLLDSLYPNFYTEEEIKNISALLKLKHNFSNSKYNLNRNVLKLTGAFKDRQELSRPELFGLMSKIDYLDCLLSSNYLQTLSSDELDIEREENHDSNFVLNLEKLEITPHREVERQRITYSKKEEDRIYKRNNKRGLEAIIHYHTQIVETEHPFVVVDKTKNLLTIYARDGEIIDTREIILSRSDLKNHGGAGIYSLDKSKDLFDSSKNYFKSISLDFELENGTKFYILPTNSNSQDFYIKNGELNFSSLDKKRNYSSYNYSKSPKEFISTSIELKEDRGDYVSIFMKKLEVEKENIMKLYNIDSDTYNELVKFSYGVLGVESKFATSLKYKIKQNLPFAVSVAKGNGFDISENSRGPTQIKRVPEKIKNRYNISKNELYKPENAAVATIGFACELFFELKNISKFHKEINFQNIYDYLYYLYQGKRYEITKGTAEPDKNLTIKKIKSFESELSIVDHF